MSAPLPLSGKERRCESMHCEKKRTTGGFVSSAHIYTILHYHYSTFAPYNVNSFEKILKFFLEMI